MTTPIHTLEAFTAPEDCRRLLATLPETALLAMIQAKSEVMDLPWLSMMLDGGLLSIEHDRAALSSQDDLGDLVEHWANRIKAFTHFMTGVAMTTVKETPVYGPVDGVLPLATFSAPDGMKTLYAAASKALAADYRALAIHPATHQNDVFDLLVDPMAQWLAGVVALDLPDVVASFARDVPTSVDGFFPLLAMGCFMNAYALPDEGAASVSKGRLEHFVSPQSAALLLSRDRCLEVLWTLGASVHDTVFVRKYDNFADQDFSMHEILDVMNPTCLPETWGRALKKGFESEGYDENQIQALYKTAMDCMCSQTVRWTQSHIPALIDAGIYNTSPANSLYHACVQGFPDVVESLSGSLQWEDPKFRSLMTTGVAFTFKDSPRKTKLFSDAAWEAAKENTSHPGKIEECVLKVIAMGVQAGHSELVFYSDQDYRPEPVCAFVDAQFHHALVKFLENGLDPHAKTEYSSSLMEYAAENSPQAAHVIQSFEARQQALGVLHEIDARPNAKPGTHKPSP